MKAGRSTNQLSNCLLNLLIVKVAAKPCFIRYAKFIWLNLTKFKLTAFVCIDHGLLNSKPVRSWRNETDSKHCCYFEQFTRESYASLYLHSCSVVWINLQSVPCVSALWILRPWSTNFAVMMRRALIFKNKTKQKNRKQSTSQLSSLMRVTAAS